MPATATRKAPHKHSVECQYLSFAQVAAYLGMTLKAVRQWHDARHLNGFPTVKIGTATCRVRICALDGWIESRADAIQRGQLV